MSAPAAISGDFCTFRHVQGRKVLQIVIEVPAEAASAVFATLGMPGSGAGIPVGIARLNPEHVTPDSDTTSSQTGPTRRTFSELPYAQQAAIRCGEEQFQQFLINNKTGSAGAWRSEKPRAEVAAMAVRYLCEVPSRKDIIEGSPAGEAWAALEAEYWSWQRGRR